MNASALHDPVTVTLVQGQTYVFAAFLNVENNEVPLNKKAFSKALQKSLEDAMTLKNNINNR